MTRHAPTDHELVILASLSLLLVLGKLMKRDRNLYKRVCGELNAMGEEAERCGYDPRTLVEFLRRRIGRRLSRVPFEQTTPGLVFDFDAVFLQLSSAPRDTWPERIPACLQCLWKPTTLSPARQQDLAVELQRVRTARKAAPAILSAAERGEPVIISTRLQRAGHRATIWPAIFSRRRSKPWAFPLHPRVGSSGDPQRAIPWAGGTMAISMRRGVTTKGAKWTGYRRILWPTDFSPLAKAALPHAVGLATETGAELVLLHVLPPLAAYTAPELAGALSVSLQRKSRAAAQNELRRLERQVKAHPPFDCTRS